LLPPDTLKRAAVLHTDVATMDVLMTKMPDVTWKYEIASLHFGAAKELVDFWRSEAGRDAFVRLWYRTTSAFLVSQYEITAAPVFLPQAVSVCRGDAHLPLMAGAVHELLASPRVQHASDVSGETREAVGPETVNLDKAETRYRQALRASPSLTEARIRLGRVLGQQGRHQQALAELKRAVSEPVPPPLRYLVYLLLGEEEEALNHRDAAREAYEHARALYPGAQSVHLALSRLERRYGDGSRAVAAIWQMFELPPTGGNRDDPWREYYTAGQGRRAAELLEELRTPFRRRQ
jgi:tetratricopeptide (TPR) repeat protein